MHGTCMLLSKMVTCITIHWYCIISDELDLRKEMVGQILREKRKVREGRREEMEGESLRKGRREREREGGGGGGNVVNKTQGNRGIPLYEQKSNTNELQELKMGAGFPSKQATYIQPNAIMSVPLSCSR